MHLNAVVATHCDWWVAINIHIHIQVQDNCVKVISGLREPQWLVLQLALKT